MLKWLLAVTILSGSLLASALMLQGMGIVDVKGMIMARLDAVPAVKSYVDVYKLGLEAERQIDRERREVSLLKAEMVRARRQLEAQKASIEQEKKDLETARSQLEQRERQLAVKEKRIKDQTQNITDFERLQALYNDIRPRDLVPILSELDDTVVARLVGGMEERRAADVLAELPADRAARISKLMGGISSK